MSSETSPKSNKKYQIILADPPWKYRLQGSMTSARGMADLHYKTLTLEKLKKINIPLDNNCILFLWVVFPELQQGLDLIRAWGFEYKTIAFTWIKENKNGSLFWGMGYYTRANAEVCLLGIKGKLKPKSHAVHSVVFAQRQEHSKKPLEIKRRIVDLMGDLPRIELFAREKTEGWDVWGNEVESDIVL